MRDDDGIPIKLITSTFVSEPTEIDPEKLQEALKMLGEAVQKRIDGEITRGLTSPSVSRPAIKIDSDPTVFDTTRSLLWHTFPMNHYSTGFYTLPSAYGSSPVMKARTRKTTRKDGREQQTCDCGCCGYPHRAGSVEGCKS